MHSDYHIVCQNSQLSESLVNHQQYRLSNNTLSNPLERISSIQQNVENENISRKNSNSIPVCIEYKKPKKQTYPSFPNDINLGGLHQWNMIGSYGHLLPEGLNLNNLRIWRMAGNFNQRIPDSVIFGKLRTWIIGQIYNQLFPANINLSELERLEMGYSFNQSFPDRIDLGNLRFLKIRERYAHPLPEIDLSQFIMQKRDGFCEYSFNQHAAYKN